MAKLLVHIHSHPEMKNNVTMGLLVAVTGFNEGHEVEIFFAADGVHLLNCKKEGEIVGQGTGDVKTHLDVLRKGNVKIYGKSHINKKKFIKVSKTGDHRICMSSMILSLVTGIKTQINDFGTVNTSSPNFLKVIKQIGGKFEIKKNR